MKNTAQIFTEFNQLLLSQYPFKDKPKMKAEYYLTYMGCKDSIEIKSLKLSLFKEYFDKLVISRTNLRSEILMLENPSKIPLFNMILDLVSDNISLLEREKNEYAGYQKESSIELLRWLKIRLPKVGLSIKDEVRKYYFRELKIWFSPQGQFKNFIYGKDFTTIDFTGTQIQLATMFIQINKNEDLIKSNWKDVAKYISENFTYNGKPIMERTILKYLNRKKTISKKNEIEIKV